MRLQNRVAIVTGGGKRIGRHYVEALAREGAAVVIAEIDEKAAGVAAREINSEGGKALGIPTDVSDEATVRGMVEQTIDRFGRIDILVNNAAIFSTFRFTHGPAETIPVDEWDRMYAVNVRGTWICCKEVIPHMRRLASGSIINVSSGVASKGTVNMLHYLSSKAAVEGITRGLARELGETGIRVNCIAPGATEAETTNTPQSEAARQRWPADRIIPRTEVPQDLVGTLLFLASDDSEFLTGQVIHVDGGSVFGK